MELGLRPREDTGHEVPSRGINQFKSPELKRAWKPCSKDEKTRWLNCGL